VNGESRNADEPSGRDREPHNAKELALWLTFWGKIAWPLVLCTFLILFNGQIRDLFNRISKLNIAGQELSFSDTLTEPIVSLSTLTEVTDNTFELNENTLDVDAYFQVCKRYIVLRTNEIPEEIGAAFNQKRKLIEVLRASIICGEFIGLIVLDAKDKYLGAFDRDFFLESIVPWAEFDNYKELKLTKDKVGWLESNTIFALALKYPEARIEAGEGFSDRISNSKSVAEALEALLKSGKSFIGVIDGFGRFQGVVTREVLVNTMLMSFTGTLLLD